MSTENTDSERKKNLLRIARISAGVVFVLLGIVGAVLPVLQGWFFFLLALITLFPAHPRVTHLLEKIEPKMPRLVRALRKLGVGVDVDEPVCAPATENDPDESR